MSFMESHQGFCHSFNVTSCCTKLFIPIEDLHACSCISVHFYFAIKLLFDYYEFKTMAY